MKFSEGVWLTASAVLFFFYSHLLGVPVFIHTGKPWEDAGVWVFFIVFWWVWFVATLGYLYKITVHQEE